MQNLIENLIKGNINKFRSSIHENLYEKLKVALEEKRKEVAQNLYNIKEDNMPLPLKKALEAKKKGKKSTDKKCSNDDKEEPTKKATKEAKGKK